MSDAPSWLVAEVTACIAAEDQSFMSAANFVHVKAWDAAQAAQAVAATTGRPAACYAVARCDLLRVVSEPVSRFSVEEL